MIKIAAIVILYNPDKDVINNIKSYYKYVDEIFVYDNTETTRLDDAYFKGLPNITYFHDYFNNGISKALNAGCEVCLKKGFDWVLTMDQDTCFSIETIENYIRCFTEFNSKETVAAFGTNYKRTPSESSDSCSYKDAERLITSGMLVNLANYKKVGGFDEALFIDLVDDDYCIAAKKKGLRLIQFTNIYITHNLGTAVYRSSIKSLFLIKKKKEIHPPLRCYYMYRNLLYIEAKYKVSNFKQVSYLRKVVISHLKVCLLYGRDSLNIIKYLIRAKRDFRKSSFGKIELNT